MRKAANGTQRDQGLTPGAPSRLLSSIPDCVAGQESQFAEFPKKNVFLGLAPTKENILAMYPTFSGVISPRDPTSKHVRSHMNPLSVMSETRSMYFFCFLSWALLTFVSNGTVSRMDGLLLSIVNDHIWFQFGNNDIHR